MSFGSWAYRKAIKRGSVYWAAGDLAAYPLYLNISSDTDIGGRLSSTAKFAVTDSDGSTQLPYGLISYSNSGGAVTANLRFKKDITAAGSAGDIIAYLYYDAAQTDQGNKSGVLDSNTKGYWPLEETPDNTAGQIKDWSGNYNATSYNTPTSTAGTVGNAIAFNGTNQEIQATGVPYSDAFTVSAFVKMPSISGAGYGSIVSHHTTASSPSDWFLYRWLSDSKLHVDIPWVLADAVVSVSTTTAGTTYHVALTRTGSTGSWTYKIYLNGTLDNSNTTSSDPVSGSRPLQMGALAGIGDLSSNYSNPTLDELRLASVARSADWIAFEYRNEKLNSDTLSLGAEEVMSAVAKTPYNPFPGIAPAIMAR